MYVWTSHDVLYPVVQSHGRCFSSQTKRSRIHGEFKLTTEPHIHILLRTKYVRVHEHISLNLKKLHKTIIKSCTVSHVYICKVKYVYSTSVCRKAGKVDNINIKTHHLTKHVGSVEVVFDICYYLILRSLKHCYWKYL